MPQRNPTRRNLLGAALALPVAPLLPALAAAAPAPQPARRLAKHPALGAPYGQSKRSAARTVRSASGVQCYDQRGTLRAQLGVF